MKIKKQKMIKIFSSIFLGVTLVSATAVTAVACTNKGKINLFDNAQQIVVNAAKYFPNMNISQAKQELSNITTAKDILSKMGYSSVQVNNITEKNNFLIIEFYILNKNNEPTSPFIVKVDFNDNNGVIAVNNNISSLKNFKNMWAQINNLSTNVGTPKIIQATNNSPQATVYPLMSGNSIINNAEVQSAYQISSSNQNGIIETNGNLDLNKIQDDLKYYLKELATKIANQWSTYTNDLQIYAGFDLNSNQSTDLNGNLWIQVTNSTQQPQSLIFQNNWQKIVNIQPNENVSLVFTFNNSQLIKKAYPGLVTNTTALGYEFDNVKLNYQIANQQAVNLLNNPNLEIGKSYSMNTLVKNSTLVNNYVNAADAFSQVINSQVNPQIIQTTIQNQIESYLNKAKISANNAQSILQLLANNVGLGQFLQKSGIYIANILDQWMDKPYLGEIIAAFLSSDNISTLLYKITTPLTNFLIGLETNASSSTKEIIETILGIIQQNFENRTQEEMNQLVSNIQSLQDELTKLLNGSGFFDPGTITSIISLLGDISKNPNIFDFIGQKWMMIRNILKQLGADGGVIKAIVDFLDSLSTPNTTDPNFNIMNVPVLDLLTNTNTNNIPLGISGLLKAIFNNNPPSFVKIIIDVLNAPNPDWTVANLQTFLNNLINIKVTDASGTVLPQISTLAGFINNGIELTSDANNKVTYDKITNLANVNMEFKFTFKYNATLDFSSVKNSLVVALAAVLKEQAGLIKLIFSQLTRMLSVKAGESFSVQVKSVNQPVVPYIINNELSWRIRTQLGFKLNIMDTLYSLFPSSVAKLYINLIFTQLKVNLSAYLKSGTWFNGGILDIKNNENVTNILKNFSSNVGYINYYAKLNLIDAVQQNEIAKYLSQPNVSTITKNPTTGFVTAEVNLTPETETYLNQIFTTNVFDNLNDPLVANWDKAAKSLIKPSYQVIADVTNSIGNPTISYVINLVFGAPIMLENSDGSYSFTNVVSLTLPAIQVNNFTTTTS